MRILLVEDDFHIVDFITAGLKAEGYSIDSCGDGNAAIEQAKGNDYNLIILDRVLPGLDGATVCSELRGVGVNTPVLMLTALDSIEDKVEGFRVGTDDYLTKPFAFDELSVRITALLRRQTAYHDKPAQIRYADLTLNRATREVHRGERLIELTPKEFYLLECLMSRAGSVVSKSKILNDVWGRQSDPITNIVEVYIRHLRKKIDADGDAPLIRTIRGFGYRLSAES